MRQPLRSKNMSEFDMAVWLSFGVIIVACLLLCFVED
jgi:hypothetical protein